MPSERKGTTDAEIIGNQRISLLTTSFILFFSPLQLRNFQEKKLFSVAINKDSFTNNSPQDLQFLKLVKFVEL